MLLLDNPYLPTQLDGLVAVSPDDGSLNLVVAVFVNSYIVIVVWILLQVSVAVLLVCIYACPAQSCSAGRVTWCPMQDNFVSYTMQAAEQANLDRIAEQKSRSEILTPLEPLIVGLVKGYIDDADLTRKLRTLYQVSNSWFPHKNAHNSYFWLQTY
jgi:hypothetical protein